jgi:hypothetical protein
MILPNEKIIFIHVPKTGGSSIENFLLQKFGYKRNPLLLIHGYGVKPYHSRDSGLVITPHMHYPLKDIVEEAIKNKIFIDTNWTIFSLVRNPYIKFISDLFFYHRCPLKYNYHQLPDINKPHYVDYCIDYYWENDQFDNYHSLHSYPQYKFFEDINIPYKIFKFEDGIKNALNSVNLYNGETIPHVLDLTNTFGIPKPKYETLYTKKLIECVNKKYQKDFEIFEYKMLDPLDFS